MKKFLIVIVVALACSFATEAKAQYVSVNVGLRGGCGLGFPLLGLRLANFRALRAVRLANRAAILQSSLVPLAVSPLQLRYVSPFQVAPMQLASVQAPPAPLISNVDDLQTLRELMRDDSEADLGRETASTVRDLVASRLQESNDSDSASQTQILDMLQESIRSINQRLDAIEGQL